MLEDDAVFETGRRVILAGKGIERESEIEFFRRQHGRCVAKFRGIDSISDAEILVGYDVKIPTETLPDLEPGWFYTFQLKGSRVFTVEGEYIGVLTDVLDTGGGEILKVDRDKEEILIPFAHSYLKEIDVDQQRIVVDLPEDLRELNR
jgi:16S rRNA processing protein RimM